MALTEYVIMPGSDYQAACDAIREKTGKSDTIPSGDMAAEVYGIVPKLQEKTVTPSEEEQEIMADEGFDGLNKVIVEAAESGVDVSGVTAIAEDVAEGKVFVDAEGNEVEGTLLVPGDSTVVFENTATTLFNFIALVGGEWVGIILNPPATNLHTHTLRTKVGSPIIGYVTYYASGMGSSTPTKTFFTVSGASVEIVWIKAYTAGSVITGTSYYVCLALIVPTESEVTVKTVY